MDKSQLDRRIETAAKSMSLSRRDALKYLLGGAAAVAFGSIGGPSMGFLKEAYAATTNIPGNTAPTYTIQQIGGIITAIPSRSVERGIARSGMSPTSSPQTIYGTDASTVIMQACTPYGKNNTKPVKVFVRAGTYIINGTNINGSVASTPYNNIELYGEPGTILKLADGKNTSVLQFSYCNNVLVHDLEINGNNLNQAGGAGGGTVGEGENIIGLCFYYANGSIYNNYIHDNRCFGIAALNAMGGNVSIYNNNVVNSDANGMNICNSDGGTTNVYNNTVNGASDVGIAIWEGNNTTVQGNTIQNITQTRSPFGWQSREFLTNEHTPTNSNNLFQNNTCNNCGGPAFYMSGGTNVTLQNNTFTNIREAIMIDTAPAALTATNNSFDQIGQVSVSGMSGAAVDISAGSSHTITENRFTHVGPYLGESSVIELTGGTGTFSGNTVSTNNGKYKAISAISGWASSNNTVVT